MCVKARRIDLKAEKVASVCQTSPPIVLQCEATKNFCLTVSVGIARISYDSRTVESIDSTLSELAEFPEHFVLMPGVTEELFEIHSRVRPCGDINGLICDISRVDGNVCDPFSVTRS